VSNDIKRYTPLSKGTIRSFITIFAILWLTGLLWILIEYTKTERADLRTSGQTILMQLHGGVAFLALMCLGSFSDHVKRGLSIKVNVPSGVSLLIYMTLLIISAWMLYYVGDDFYRSIASWTHLTLGIVLPLLILGHSVLGKRLLKAKQRLRSGRS